MRKFLFGCAIVSAVLALSPVTTAAAESFPSQLTASQQTTYDYAVESFRAQRYDAAYGRFIKLADAGHAQSAQMALAMYRNGASVFGREWDATPEQIERWTTLIVLDEIELANIALLR